MRVVLATIRSEPERLLLPALAFTVFPLQEVPLRPPGNKNYYSIADSINRSSSSAGGSSGYSSPERNTKLRNNDRRSLLLEDGEFLAGFTDGGHAPEEKQGEAKWNDEFPDIGLDLTSRYHIAIPLSYFCVGFLGR